MADAVFVVRAHELSELIGSQPFLALPTEELAYYYGAIEVLAVERVRAQQDAKLIPLATYTVIHHNYAWFTYERTVPRAGAQPAPRRSMGLVGSVGADGGTMLFLDERAETHALRTLRSSVIAKDKCDLRFAGIVQGGADAESARRFGLVYVARLRQPGLELRDPTLASVRFCGPLELAHDREQFDAWSQHLITKLHAL